MSEIGWLEDDKGNKSSIRLMSFIALAAAIYFGVQLAQLASAGIKATEVSQQLSSEIGKAIQACTAVSSPVAAGGAVPAVPAKQPSEECAKAEKIATAALDQAKSALYVATKQEGLTEIRNLIIFFLVSAFAPKVWQKYAENGLPKT